VRHAWLLAICAPLAAQDPQLALMRLRMTENLRGLPNYTCLETIERTRVLKGGGVRMSDRLRLEVALVDGKEMFGWPGSSEFEDVQARLVERGTFGAGNFALYARALFAGQHARFGPPAAVALQGRNAVRWEYRVGRESGGLQIIVGDRAALVGFHGAVYADPESLDVLRLEVVADPAPEALGTMQSRDTVEYARVPIGGESFLLPVASELIMTLRDREDTNRVSFSSCRRFAGESRILFEETEETGAAAPVSRAVQAAAETLPVGLELELELTEPIDTVHAAAGDAVRARLRRGLEWGGRRRVPADALAEGRITRVESYGGRTLLGLRFFELAWPGGRVRLDLRLVDAGGFDRSHSRRQFPLSVGIHRQEGVFQVRAARPVVPRGARLIWRTGP
jgi:hypothetical protein